MLQHLFRQLPSTAFKKYTASTYLTYAGRLIPLDKFVLLQPDGSIYADNAVLICRSSWIR